MRMAAVALMLFGLVAGCARTYSASPSNPPAAGATVTDRNRAGYGLHIGLGGFTGDSGVWDVNSTVATGAK